MIPTDADRQRARELCARVQSLYRNDNWAGFMDDIASAIAAARADALEQAAQAARAKQMGDSDTWAIGWNRACDEIEIAIRALKEPGHGG